MESKRRGDVRIEALRIVGALSVFAYHYVGDALAVLGTGAHGSWWWQALRYGSGSFGVAMFVVISGATLTWAWPRAQTAIGFIRRRLTALLPLYWWIAVPLIVVALAAHRMPLTDLWKVPVWLSGLGIVSPATFFPVVDGWWYMTLAVQLVVVYPMLRRLFDRIGAAPFLLLSAAVTVASAWGLLALGLGYATPGFFGSRLVEFAVGMTLGSLIAPGGRAWPGWATTGAGALALTVCALALPGAPTQIVVAPILVCLVVGAIGNVREGRAAGAITALGALTYAFYLSHSPWAKPVLEALSRAVSPQVAAAIGAPVCLVLAVLVAWGFHSSFTWASRRLGTSVQVRHV